MAGHLAREALPDLESPISRDDLKQLWHLSHVTKISSLFQRKRSTDSKLQHAYRDLQTKEKKSPNFLDIPAELQFQVLYTRWEPIKAHPIYITRIGMHGNNARSSTAEKMA